MPGPKFSWDQFEDAQVPAATKAGKFSWDDHPDAESNAMDVVDTAGTGQAALEHFGNAASMGYLPQLQGAAAKLTPDPNSGVNAKLRAQGFNIQEPDQGYTATRDASINRMSQQEADHPVASGIGTGAGILASGLATSGLGGARAATAGGRILQGVKTGALMASVANPGDTEGEVDPLQVGARVDNAKKGALTGGIVSGAVEAAPLVMRGLRSAATKLGSALSGRTEDEITHYANREGIVDQLIKSTGGDMTNGADDIRKELSQGIQNTKKSLGAQVQKAVDAAPKEKSIDLDHIIAPLEKQQSALLAKNQHEEAAQVGRIIDKVKSFGFEKDPTYGTSQYTGKINASELNNIKGLLQDIATPSYQPNGQIFNYARDSQRAAKYAAAVARKTLNATVDGVSEPNNQLSAMHIIEDNLNRNLLAAGKPDSALFAAASGANPRNQAMMAKLGDVAGVDVMNRIKDLNAARTFANPALLPADATGKTVARQGVAKAIGTAVGGIAGMLGGHSLESSGIGAAIGNQVAGTLASPAMVKAGVKIGNRLSGPANAAIAAAQRNPMLLQRIGQAATSSPDNRMVDQESGQPKLGSDQPSAKQNRTPSGTDRWAQQGAQSLQLQDDDTARVMSSPKGYQLLIQASDLKPGSKAMKNINAHIQAILKGAK